jgi:hypothetical protein
MQKEIQFLVKERKENKYMRDQIMKHVLFKIKVLVEEGDDIQIFNEMSKLLKPVRTKDLNEFIIER